MSLSLALCGPIGAAFDLDIALDLPGAGVTCLLGPSGSGKTSVLRAIAGLERGLAGTIRYGDELWQGPGLFVPPHRRRVGYVFQGAGLLPHLSIARNLDYAARRAGNGPFVRDDVIARTGIAHLLDRMPARLSGGEGQRASIARALLSQPRLLLMDEPLSALDSESKALLLDHFEGLLGAIGLPVLYVTHDEGEARRLARRCVRLRHGRVEAIEERPPPG